MNEDFNTNSQNNRNDKATYHVALEEWIARMKLAFSNAKLPEIQSELSLLGYTPEKLDSLLTKVTELETLNQQQKKEYAEQYEESAKVDEKRKEINEKYKTHLALCRILFKDNVKATTALEFNGKRKTAYGAWYQQVSNFYAQLLQTPEFLNKLQTIQIEESELNTVKDLLTEMSQLRESQKKETAEAQKATEVRDTAFDELYPQYADLIAYAKVVLSKEQHLEAMGIVVKR